MAAGLVVVAAAFCQVMVGSRPAAMVGHGPAAQFCGINDDVLLPDSNEPAYQTLHRLAELGGVLSGMAPSSFAALGYSVVGASGALLVGAFVFSATDLTTRINIEEYMAILIQALARGYYSHKRARMRRAQHSLIKAQSVVRGKLAQLAARRAHETHLTAPTSKASTVTTPLDVRPPLNQAPSVQVDRPPMAAEGEEMTCRLALTGMGWSGLPAAAELKQHMLRCVEYEYAEHLHLHGFMPGEWCDECRCICAAGVGAVARAMGTAYGHDGGDNGDDDILLDSDVGASDCESDGMLDGEWGHG